MNRTSQMRIEGTKLHVGAHEVDIDGLKTAYEVNERLSSLGISQRVRQLTPAEQKRMAESTIRRSMIMEIRTHDQILVEKALRAAKRKGWGLEGMSLEKLKEVLSYLRL